MHWNSNRHLFDCFYIVFPKVDWHLSARLFCFINFKPRSKSVVITHIQIFSLKISRRLSRRTYYGQYDVHIQKIGHLSQATDFKTNLKEYIQKNNIFYFSMGHFIISFISMLHFRQMYLLPNSNLAVLLSNFGFEVQL